MEQISQQEKKQIRDMQVRIDARNISQSYRLISTAYANGELICPTAFPTGNVEISKHASDQKSYGWKSRQVRMVQSAACALYMDKPAGYTVFFVTLTEPESIESNQPITLWINNLRKQKQIHQFVWVRERQQRGANHYHVIFSSSYSWLNIGLFQKAWNSALITSGGKGAPNSLRLGDRPIVESIGAVSNYISKYMSKGGNSETYKLYAYTRGLRKTCQTDLLTDMNTSPYLSYCTEYALINRYTVTEKWWSSVKSYQNEVITTFQT